MKTFTSLLAASCLTLFTTIAQAGPATTVPVLDNPNTVTEVDLDRYAGVWKEIAHAPNAEQANCKRSIAEYGVLSPVLVSVHNVCVKADGSTTDIRGQATAPNPKEPGKLEVTFENIPVKGEYWIVRLDPDYQWAVVSSSERKTLYILSRQAPMATALLQTILSDLKADGFNTDTLVYDDYTERLTK